MGASKPTVGILKNAIVLLLLLAAGTASLSAQRLGQEESARFLTFMREQLAAKQADSILEMVWWGNAEEDSKNGLRTAFAELSRHRLHSMKLRPLGAEDRLLDGSDRSVTTDLPVRAILSIEIAAGEEGSDALFLFEYPVGQAEGKVWILPVLDRSRR